MGKLASLQPSSRHALSTVPANKLQVNYCEGR